MEYKIKMHDTIYTVQVDQIGDHFYRVSILDSDHHVDILEVSENLYSMICDGKSNEVDIMEEEDTYEIFVKGKSYWAEILRPVKMPLHPAKGREPASLPHEEVVASPLSSKVVKILVEAGEKVEIDQALLIIEAMKMEMPISSPFGGRVKEVLVKEGQDVEKGTNLLTLTPL
jgi:biotin carboxyl carrier protein